MFGFPEIENVDVMTGLVEENSGLARKFSRVGLLTAEAKTQATATLIASSGLSFRGEFLIASLILVGVDPMTWNRCGSRRVLIPEMIEALIDAIVFFSVKFVVYVLEFEVNPV
jgi:hypothetical protein